MEGYLVKRSLPRARQERSRVYREAVAAFAKSGEPCVLVRLPKKQEAAYAGLRSAIADLGFGGMGVSRRKGDLYLVRR